MLKKPPALGVSHLTALDASPEDFVRHAAVAGFDAVGLRIAPPPHTPDQWPVAGDRARTRALRRLADDVGIGVMETEGFSMRPATDVSAMLPGLEASAELGSRFILSAGVDPDETRMVANYQALCAAAAPFGLTVAIEFISWNPLRTLADAVRVFDLVGAANVGILVDFLHFCRTGGDPRDLAAIPSAKLAYAQLCDGAAMLAPGVDLADEARTRRNYPGEGALPVAALVAALPAGLPITLEAPSGPHTGLPAQDRIRIAAQVTRAFLAAHPQLRAEPSM